MICLTVLVTKLKNSVKFLLEDYLYPHAERSVETFEIITFRKKLKEIGFISFKICQVIFYLGKYEKVDKNLVFVSKTLELF